jgi:hypothetical protein
MSFRNICFTVLVSISLFTSCSSSQKIGATSSSISTTNQFGNLQQFYGDIASQLTASEYELNLQDRSWYVHKSKSTILQCTMSKLLGYVLSNYESENEFLAIQGNNAVPYTLTVGWFESCSGIQVSK